jgi:hypothetical protein
VSVFQQTCVAALSALSLTLLAKPAVAQGTPVTAVRDFYAVYSKNPFSGLPTGADWRRVARHMSTPLAKMIRAAQREQARCQKAHPDEKPPWIEGDMFTSNFEGLTRFKVSDSLAVSGPNPAVNVDFDYVDRGQTFSWRDQVLLVKENGRWVIDDVRYRKGEGFGNGFGEGLRHALSIEGAC